jgi:hypothetical protein
MRDTSWRQPDRGPVPAPHQRSGIQPRLAQESAARREKVRGTGRFGCAWKIGGDKILVFLQDDFMKRKILLATVIVCVTVFFIVILFDMIRGAKLMGRADFAQSGISSLAVFIEVYRDNYGSYPSSLEEMVRKAKTDNQAYLNEKLHDQFHNKYEYQPSTNGFVITVTTPNSWFVKYDKIEKRYSLGEALK